MRKHIGVLVAMFLVASAFPAASASIPDRRQTWLERADDPGRVLEAVSGNRDKLPSNYLGNLRYELDDGSVRVMVALARRDAGVESFVRRVTRDLHWYGRYPRFYARVDQQGFASLLQSSAVTFVEPDYPLSYLLAGSVVDVSARGDAGVWQFDPATGPMGTLSSGIPNLTRDEATGKGVTVAVVDSGIDKTHRDFGGWDCNAGIYSPCQSRIVKAVAVDQVGRTGTDPGDAMPTTEIASGHGTHVGGIIAGNGYYARDGEDSANLYGGDGFVIGMAPQASLVSIKVGDGPSAALGVSALQWTLDNARKYGIRVSNNSWGCISGCAYNPESVLARVQRDLYYKGVVTVFAAGNGGGNGGGAELSGNSQSPYVLSVAAYDHVEHELASFSSRGRKGVGLAAPTGWTPESEGSDPPRRPDIAAPGYFVYSAASLTGGYASVIPRVDPKDAGLEPGAFAYTFMSGTSMAAPHVTGAAAVLLGACSDAAPLDVMRALMVGADPTRVHKTDASATAEPFEVGYGALDVRPSLEWLLAQPACA